MAGALRSLLFAILVIAPTTAFAQPLGGGSLVAHYDRLLAGLEPGQETIALGDMIVPVQVVRAWRNKLAGVTTSSASQTGVTLWPGGNVVYAFNANVTAENRRHFRDACAEWAMFAALTFVERTTETDYIMVNDDPNIFGGNSHVGKTGGAQPLNIGSSSWNRPTLVHEIGHALGLIHEHQRSDRDNFVTIHPDVLGDGNFILIPTSTNQGAYDFLSCMHYARDTFAPPDVDYITPKPAYVEFFDLMGRFYLDRWLSRGDRNGIAALYGAGPALGLVVTNTNDSGPGSLRAALYRALDIVTDTPSATPTITFEIPASDPEFAGGVFTIAPTDRLIGPGSKVTIDAATQAAFTGNTNANGPEVVLSGALISTSSHGLGFVLGENDTTVRGFTINGFSTQGMLIVGTNNRVEGCYIGTNAAGTAAVANAFAGIEIQGGATGNHVGGTTVGARNVISGNGAQGVFIRGAGTSGNFVEGNFLGTNAAGTGAVPNGFAGVEILECAGNFVGGTTVGAGNVLSGNTFQGVLINNADGNVVAGNLIGTTAAGTAALANGSAGVALFGSAQANTIGGTTAAARNILSGNTHQGVAISGAGTTGNIVAGNYIGLNGAGTASIGNGFGGVQIFSGAANNTIGGSSAGAGNVIAGNPASGVSVSGVGSSGNMIAGNLVGLNAAGTSAVPNAFAGVTIFGSAKANTIGGSAGNVISGNSSQGVLISGLGSDTNVVAGNWIGLNAAGTAAVANGFSGVQIASGAKDNLIGGTTVAARNILSGNTNQGVAIGSIGTNDNRVSGNYIGTDPAGAAAIANGFPGVEIFSGASGNTIGGAEPGEGNVISGNAVRGITLADAGTDANVIAGNFIGLNAAGTAALPNAGPGVAIFTGAQGNVIGGTSGGRNFIGGNAGPGVQIAGAGADANFVRGNSIGVTPTGALVGNTGASGAGVQLFNGAQQNVIGGAAPGAANLIAGNAQNGVEIYDTAVRTTISGNSFAGNGGLAINLQANNGAFGVTANDAGDGDSGPNALQNYPVLTSAVLGLGTTVQGSLNSTASSTFRVEFFAITTADASGFGEGENFIGAIDVMTNGSGNATINHALAATVPAGQRISATATDANGNTSEFSGNVIVTTTDTDGDGMPDVYETAHGLNPGVNDAALDTDGDGESNLAEFRAGTLPNDPASVLRLDPVAFAGGDVQLSLPTAAGRTYRIEFADDLAAPTPWRTLADQIFGTGSAIPLVDPGAAALLQRYYRGVVLP